MATTGRGVEAAGRYYRQCARPAGGTHAALTAQAALDTDAGRIMSLCTNEGCRVLVLVRPDRPQPVAMVLRLAALMPRHGMGVVEPDQPLAVRPVQCQRVVHPVRLLRRRRHSRHDEPDPVAALRVHHEHLPVQVEKHIEGRVAGRLNLGLSD